MRAPLADRIRPQTLDDFVGQAAARANLRVFIESARRRGEANVFLLLEVTPALTEFSKTAEHKWKPDPTANDFSKLAQNLGALSDYMAFFEGHGTRITEFYVLLIKVHDARAQVLWRRAYDEAVKTHEAERAALSAKLEGDVSDEERKRLEKELERNKLAREKLDEAAKAQEEAIAARRQAAPEKHGYTLSDAEVARVEARIDEINAVFKEAGFDKKDPPLPKAVEVKEP